MRNLAEQIYQMRLKNAVIDGTDAGNHQVKVTLDGDKLTNFDKFDDKALTTENTVEITKRDLSTAGTKNFC